MVTTKWVLDPTHSELEFKVKHLMITTVTGKFNDFSAELLTDSDEFNDTKVSFAAQVSSISTNNADRDNHLKGGDFFDADQFPVLKFEGATLTRDREDYILSGNLTIKQITKPFKLNVEFGGIATDPWGNVKAGFTLSGKINRSDFGLTWNAALETGGVMVSEDVRILGELQFIKQA